MLVYFNNLYKLRNVEKENSELVSSFLFDAVENYIVRFDSHIIARYPEYKLDNKQQMIRALKSIEYLTEYYIRRFFAKQNIVEDFMEETGFGEENCLKYAELVDSHFQELKINILMHDVEELQDIINRKG